MGNIKVLDVSLSVTLDATPLLTQGRVGFPIKTLPTCHMSCMDTFRNCCALVNFAKNIVCVRVSAVHMPH
jgi:hypothetical protein